MTNSEVRMVPMSTSSDVQRHDDPCLPPGIPLYAMNMVVKWGDMDALGHVNNAQYFRYFEQVRLSWYYDSKQGVLGDSNEGFVIVNNYAEYLKPLLWPATINVRMAGHSPGRSSFMSTYSICIGDELYTTGYSKVVWFDSAKKTSVALPSAVVEQLAP